MARLHRRMVRLHSHSLTCHVFAGVVSRCLPCGFRLNSSAFNFISATCSVEFAGPDFLTPGRSWTARIMTWHVSGSVVASSCAVSEGRGDDGYCLREARRRRTINALGEAQSGRSYDQSAVRFVVADCRTMPLSH